MGTSSKFVTSRLATAAAHGGVAVSSSLGVLVLLLSAVGSVQCQCQPTSAGLSENFYKESCPQLSSIVNDGLVLAALTDIRITASLLRVSFHDCWIRGCDASLLLDNDTALGIISEKFARPNLNSIRGFPVLDAIKAQLEAVCPHTVSCADLVSIAARDSVVLSGGLGWPVLLGRRDSLNSSFAEADLLGSPKGIPNPFDTLKNTTANFALRNFSADEMVTLSGSHTFGRAHCAAILTRFNGAQPFHLNDTNINPILRKDLIEICNSTANGTADIVIELDVSTPDTFDNQYFRNLQFELGILHTDQNLVSAPGANTALVKLYSTLNDVFLVAFAEAMFKMQNLCPLTGTEGEIRVQCGKVNSPKSSKSSKTSSESSIAVE